MELKNIGHVLDGTERYLELTHIHNSWADSSVGYIYIYIYINIYIYIYIYIYNNFDNFVNKPRFRYVNSMPSEDNTTNSNDNNSEKLEMPPAKSKK